MQIYGPFRFNPVQTDRGVQRAAPQPQVSSPANSSSSIHPVDELSLSSEAQGINRLAGVHSAEGDFRAERIADIRRAIADGSYETIEKLDGAVDRLLDQLG
jgi:anti-sigma28 factor (negative regulator of flagellin synthesis)